MRRKLKKEDKGRRGARGRGRKGGGRGESLGKRTKKR